MCKGTLWCGTQAAEELPGEEAKVFNYWSRNGPRSEGRDARELGSEGFLGGMVEELEHTRWPACV